MKEQTKIIDNKVKTAEDHYNELYRAYGYTANLEQFEFATPKGHIKELNFD